MTKSSGDQVLVDLRLAVVIHLQHVMKVVRRKRPFPRATDPSYFIVCMKYVLEGEFV